MNLVFSLQTTGDPSMLLLSVSAYIPHFHLTNIFNDVLFQPTNTTQSPGIEISVSHESCWPPIRSPRLRLSGNRNIDLHTEQLIHHFYHWSCSHSCSRLADLHHEQRSQNHYFFIVSSSSIYLIPLIILIQSSPRFILKSLATKEDTINTYMPAMLRCALFIPSPRTALDRTSTPYSQSSYKQWIAKYLKKAGDTHFSISVLLNTRSITFTSMACDQNPLSSSDAITNLQRALQPLSILSFEIVSLAT